MTDQPYDRDGAADRPTQPHIQRLGQAFEPRPNATHAPGRGPVAEDRNHDASDGANAIRDASEHTLESGLDFVQRWEASALLTGLVSGARAHRILLELVRVVRNAAPPDEALAYARIYELQQFLNALSGVADGLRAPEIPEAQLAELLDRTKILVSRTTPVIAAIQGTEDRARTSPIPGALRYARHK